jgi:predicted transglutaminase-like cysteine proteinase
LTVLFVDVSFVLAIFAPLALFPALRPPNPRASVARRSFHAYRTDLPGRRAAGASEVQGSYPCSATVLVVLLTVGLELEAGTFGWRSLYWIGLAAVALQLSYLVVLALWSTRFGCTLSVTGALALLLFPSDILCAPMAMGQIELAPMGFVSFCREKPYRCAPAEPQIVRLTPARWSQLVAVNSGINREIIPMTVPPAGRPWRDDARRGNCNDYALTKRSRLLDEGWPASALLIATAQIPSGEGHAVLLAVTDKGDLVLDNLRDGVVSFDRLPYRWVKRMSAENPLRWRKIAPRLRDPSEPFSFYCA